MSPMSDLRIDWLGHATVRIELDGVTFLTDPTVRDRIGPLDRKSRPIPHHELAGVDAVLLSHLHHDHLDLASLRRLGEPRLVVPSGSGAILRRAGHTNVDEFSPGQATHHGGVLVEIVHAEHSGFRPPFGPTAPALGFIVSNARHRIFFAGDTALHPGMAGIPDLDIALIPVWGWGPRLRGGHMDPVMAAEALRLLRPRIAVPIHWGTFWPKAMGSVRPHRLRRPGHDFREAAAELAPDVRTIVTMPGHRIALPR
jgi:L-ascorbate metabolism protein UlaG (beta-lactamase superfamily)